MNALGRSRGGVSTKVHVLSDANGLPLAVHLTPGQTADIAAAPDLLALGEARPRELFADKGYDADGLRGAISARRSPDHPVEVEPQSARHAG
ncbi:MAG: transposase [Rhodobacteraceae bacterium]|nr:transposase [Paracoccaceae bacterium]